MSVVTSFAQLIPPPLYLELPSIGLDVSDTSVKYVQLTPNYHDRGTYEVGLWGDIDIAADAVSRGQVNDVNALALSLQEVRERTGVTNVRVSLPEERAYIFETEVKRNISVSEIRAQLEFKLAEHVPLSPRDAFFDYDIIEEKENTLNVSVVVYARDTIMSYHEACQQAGLMPVAFEVEAQAIARSTLPQGHADTHMIIDFGKTRTGLGIVFAGHLLYTSTIDIGGAELSRAMRRQLGNDVAESELTQIKNTEGLLPRRENTKICEALLTAVATIKDEVATRLQYWHTRDHDRTVRRISSIVLCGGSANLKGGPEYLTETLGIPTVRGNVWRNILADNEVPPIEKRFSYGYATAVGLAMRNVM